MNRKVIIGPSKDSIIEKVVDNYNYPNDFKEIDPSDIDDSQFHQTVGFEEGFSMETIKINSWQEVEELEKQGYELKNSDDISDYENWKEQKNW